MKPDAFREAREALDMTQADLAWKLDVSLRTITNYETGKTRIPRAVAVALDTWRKEPVES